LEYNGNKKFYEVKISQPQIHPHQSFNTHHKAQDVMFIVITVVWLRKEVLQNIIPCHWSSGSWHTDGNTVIWNVRNHYWWHI